MDTEPNKSSADARDIRRRSSGEFWEYADIWVSANSGVRRCVDNEPVEIAGGEWLYSAKRRVRKTGKPMGPWLLIVNGVRCAVDQAQQSSPDSKE